MLVGKPFLTGDTLSTDELDFHRPNHLEILAVMEDPWDQLSRLNKLIKDGRYVPNKVKNSLRSFAYCIDYRSYKAFNLDRKPTKILTEIKVRYSNLKPDKGNGIL